MRFGRVVLCIVRPIVFLLFPYKVIGRENMPKEGALLMYSNHISVVDPVFLLFSQRRHVHFMAKAELFRRRFLRWVFGSVMGAFPVERGKGDSGALDNAISLLNDGKVVGIFPEGHRSKDGKLLRFKSGAALIAAAGGAPVLPVALLCKDQRVRLFHRTTIVLGRPIGIETLHLTGEKPELRYAIREMTHAVEQLMEEHR